MAAAASAKKQRLSGEKLRRIAAEELLCSEGLAGVRVHRLERQTADICWALYERKGEAWTAILSGEKPKDWALLRTLEGWPVR